MWKWVFLQAVVLRIETGEEGGKEERRQSHAGCLFPWSRTHKTGEDLHFSLFFCERLSTWGGLSVNNRIIFSLATFRSWVFCWVDFFFFSFFFFLFLSRSTAKFLMRFLMSYWWENVKWFLVTVHSSPVMPPRSRLLFFFFFSFLIYWFTESPATSPRAYFARLHVPSRTLSVCTGPRTTATSCSPSDHLHTYTHTLLPQPSQNRDTAAEALWSQMKYWLLC